jgi:hypothetical protein
MMTRRVALLLVAVSALAACIVPPARDPVDSFSSVASDETVVVGRVELVPALRKGEQKIKTLNSGSFENKVFLIADEQPRVLTKEPAIADYKGRIEATLGKNFFIRSRSKPFYIVGGMMYLDIGSRETNQAYFPGGLMVPLKTGDKAVYIGTIRYHRNEFWEITKVAIADDYDSANAEFKKKFGAKYSLRKAYLTQMK